MAAAIYVLCCLTSLACAVLLLRAYRRSGARLLLWSGLCFVGFALNNGLLVADRLLFPQVDLYFVRNVPTLVGLALLVYGLVWEAE